MNHSILRRLVIGAAVLFASTLLAQPAQADIVRASWYGIGDGFHGRKMAYGEIFNAYDIANAAHRTLPEGTTILVSYPVTGKWVCVEVMDKGPFVAGRTLDLSYAAAEHLDYINVGVADVNMWVTNCEPGTSG